MFFFKCHVRLPVVRERSGVVPLTYTKSHEKRLSHTVTHPRFCFHSLPTGVRCWGQCVLFPMVRHTVAMLLCAMGPAYTKVFNKFTFTNNDQKKQLKIVLEKFDSYFEPKKLGQFFHFQITIIGSMSESIKMCKTVHLHGFQCPKLRLHHAPEVHNFAVRCMNF